MVWSIDIYAPFKEAIAGWFRNSENQGSLLKEGYTSQQLDDAISAFCKLADLSNSTYFRKRQILFSDPEKREAFLEDIIRLHENVLITGKIERVSEDFFMTEEEGRAQCARADMLFTERPDLQALLAQANYTFFTGRTMADAEDFINSTSASFYTKGMFHLTASNAAIGYSIKEYLLEMSKKGETVFTITDLGSGSGATLAAIMLGLSEADRKLNKEIKIRINSIEGCPGFYKKLETQIAPGINKKAEGLRNIELETDFKYGDIYEGVKNVKVDGTQIYTANYVFHRISDQAKEDICSILAGKSEGMHAAFFVGDTYRNNSPMPNCGYFNLAFNGPLNTGNDRALMISLFYANGFRTVLNDENLASDFPWLPSAVSRACENAQKAKQGFLVAGFKYS